MAITRERPGVVVELKAKAIERIAPKSGVALVPYQAEWGNPDTLSRMYGYDERYAETLAQVDTVELAAESGATILGYRMTNGNAKAAKYTQAGAIEISARYPGTYGNNVKVVILPSTAEPTKKELQVRDTTGILEKFSFTDADELVRKTDLSTYIRTKKLGTTAITDVSETALSGGATGSGTLTIADFTKLFNAIGGADFDTLYLPSDDPAIQAAAKQFISDRRKIAKKMASLVIGGAPDDDLDMTKHISRSTGMNARYVINSSIAGTHVNGKTYNSVQFAAWTAGMIAATPAHQSLTAVVAPLKRAAKDWSSSEILNGLANGVFMATRDGTQYIIESAVNTLSTLGINEREDYGKIRVSMTLDQIVNDLNTVVRKYKGKLNNNDIGGAIFVEAVSSYLRERERQGAIDAGWTFIDKKNPVFDHRGFELRAKPLDAIENFDVEWEVL